MRTSHFSLVKSISKELFVLSLLGYSLHGISAPIFASQISQTATSFKETSVWKNTNEQGTNFSQIGVVLEKSNSSEIIYSITPKLLGLDTIQLAGEKFLLPTIAGAHLDHSIETKQQVHTPQKLVITIPITVSKETGWFLRSTEVGSKIKNSLKIAPVPEMRVVSSDSLSAETLPQEFYTFFPEKFANQTQNQNETEYASLRYGGISGNEHILLLDVLVAQWNLLENITELPSNIRVRIAFDSTNGVEQLSKQPSTILVDEPISNGAWAKITIGQEGIYRITAQQLTAAGITPKASEIASLKVFGTSGIPLNESVTAGRNNTLQELPLIVRTSNTGELDDIIFYSPAASWWNMNKISIANSKPEHEINQYLYRDNSNQNVTLLVTFGGKNGSRIVQTPTPTGTVQSTPMIVTGAMFSEEDLTNPYSPGSGRRWFGRSVINSGNTSYAAQLPGFVRAEGENILYRFGIAHISRIPKDANNYNPAVMSISESGTALTKANLPLLSGDSYDAAYYTTISASLPSTALSDSRSALRFDYVSSSDGASARGLVDFFEILYPRELKAVNGAIDFINLGKIPGITEYTISGFTGSIFGFEVSNPKNIKQLTNTSNTGGIFQFRDNQLFNSGLRYFISSELKSPLSVTKLDAPMNLRSDIAGASVLLVTSKSLLSSANNYKAYRESQGELNVKVVAIEDIYAEFSSGNLDATALRDYIAFATQRWQIPPQYVLLWGSSHYDFRNIRSNVPSFLPLYLTDDRNATTLNAINSYSTEDFFACINGEDFLPDLAIGRIPIRNNEQGEIVIRKIQQYENASPNGVWRSTVTSVADDSWTPENQDGSTHTRGSESILPAFPDFMRQRKIYLPEYPVESVPGGRRKPTVTPDILRAVNSYGTLVLNWVGHGNPRVWAHEQVLDKETTIPQMKNADKLFFLGAATCDYGRFDDVDRTCGAEDMFLLEGGGAIGVLAATRVVFSGSNEDFARSFYGNAFTCSGSTYTRLGDALRKTKLTKTSDNDRKYFLMGDPTLRLAAPNYSVNITQINRVTTGSTNVNLSALSRVEVSGEILSPCDYSSVAQDFNGVVSVSVLESDVAKRVQDCEPTSPCYHEYSIFGPFLNSGVAEVRNGKFTVQVVLPKDISFSPNKGRMISYAFDGRKQAAGIFRNFTVQTIDTTVIDDGNGPEMNVFLDDRTFRSGDIVKPTPTLLVDLKDETGINATGLGVGHDIEAWIDNNTIPISLTSSYAVSLEDPSKGTVEKNLGLLTAGNHTAKVRAWDVFNNPTERTVSFRILSRDDWYIGGDAENYPNPFSQNTTLRLRHNSSSSINYNILITNVDGKIVKTMSGVTSELAFELLWDGRDATGTLLPSGTYFYRIHFETENNKSTDLYGKMTIIR